MFKKFILVLSVLGLVLFSGCINTISALALEVEYLENNNNTLFYNGSINITGNFIINGTILNTSGGGSEPTPTPTTETKTRILLETDFIYNNAGALTPFFGTAASSGTLLTIAGTTNNLNGVISLRDSTTAKGGYLVRTDVTAILLQGKEKGVFIFNKQGSLVTTHSRLGFQDSTTITAPVDGCFFEILQNNLTAKCRNNNVMSNGSMLVITSNVWYKGVIEVAENASSVNFLLMNLSNSVFYNQTIITNIPKTAGRNTGFGVGAFETTISAGAEILRMDYMSLEYEKPYIYN